MNVLLYGATGMVGQAALLACLRDARVTRVVTVGRRVTGSADPRVHEIVVADLTDLSRLRVVSAGIDACIFALGASALGRSEAEYTRINFDLPMAAASALGEASPGARFLYVSGMGTDSSGQGRVMWARVKGRTENALRDLPTVRASVFRPGIIFPMDGIRSATRAYDIAYLLLGPVQGVIERLAPRTVTNTRRIGHAFLQVAGHGWPSAVLEAQDINAAADAYTAAAPSTQEPA